MMSELYTIKDERTVYCRAAMKANGGVWNPVTRNGCSKIQAIMPMLWLSSIA